jgi:hypothetical protein
MAIYYLGSGGSDSADGLSWAARWLTYTHAGAVMVAGDVLETAAPPSTPASYCTRAQVQAAMPDGNWGSTYDNLLDVLIPRACRLIDKFCGKKPGAFQIEADSTRYFDGSGTSILKIGELAAAPTSVGLSFNGGVQAADYTALVATDYLLFPWNAADEGLPYTEMHLDKLNSTYSVWYAYPRSVKVVGKFGYSTEVPDDVEQAAVVQVARWFKRGQQGFSDTGAIVELGQLTYTKRLDPEVQEILSHYRGSPI